MIFYLIYTFYGPEMYSTNCFGPEIIEMYMKNQYGSEINKFYRRNC